MDVMNLLTFGEAATIFYFLARVISYIARSSVAVYGYYDTDDRDENGVALLHGTFVLQNEEDVPIERGLRVKVEIDEFGARFEEPPDVNCRVPQKIASRSFDEQGHFVVEFPCMPALDVWNIYVETKASPENVWISVESRQKARFWLSEIHPRQRSLASSAELAFPRWKPPWRAGIAAIAAAVLIYLFPILTAIAPSFWATGFSRRSGGRWTGRWWPGSSSCRSGSSSIAGARRRR